MSSAHDAGPAPARAAPPRDDGAGGGLPPRAPKALPSRSSPYVPRRRTRRPLERVVSAADRCADEVHRTAGAGLDLVLPRPCASCGRGNEPLCPVCAALFHRFTSRPVDVASAVPAWPDELPCTAAGVYGHEVARAVLAWKNHGRRDLTPVLSRALGRVLEHALAAGFGSAGGGDGPSIGPPADLLLVPVPSSAASRRRRGFSPAAELARRAAPDGTPVLECLLRRETASERWGLPVPGSSGERGGQKGLGARQRRDRMHGSMVAGFAPPRGWLQEPDLEGRRCLVVDDVVTTGASLKEAARALAAAGAEVGGAVVLAAVRAPVRTGTPTAGPT